MKYFAQGYNHKTKQSLKLTVEASGKKDARNKLVMKYSDPDITIFPEVWTEKDVQRAKENKKLDEQIEKELMMEKLRI